MALIDQPPQFAKVLGATYTSVDLGNYLRRGKSYFMKGFFCKEKMMCARECPVSDGEDDMIKGKSTCTSGICCVQSSFTKEAFPSVFCIMRS